MKNSSKKYHLVARLQGDQLMLTTDVRDALAACYDRRVEQLTVSVRDRDRRVHLISLEMERKGDFLWACGARLKAINAYVSAAAYALDGNYYDWDATQYPSFVLYHRSRELVRKIRQCAATDRRLVEILKLDRHYKLLQPWDEWVQLYE